MKVLVLGSGGLLGRAVSLELDRFHAVEKRTRRDYDLLDYASLRADLESTRPEAVINCAGYARVDDAEDDEDSAREINVRAAAAMAEKCSELGIRLVHFSSDYVFDGRKGPPYKEDDAPNPLNVYGRTKLESEREVLAALPSSSLIIRTSWLFGKGGKSFVGTLLGRYEEGVRKFRIVSDQVGRPTYAPDLSRAVRLCLEKGLTGIYHACNEGEVSWHGLALALFEAAGLADEVEVEAIVAGQFPARAVRPARSVLDTGKLSGAGIELPDFRDALRRWFGG